MEKKRSPRFRRIAAVAPIQLTERDRDIIRFVHRHRFLRSHQIAALVGGSEQQILRRLQLLYHNGYLERPRAQIQYYERGGSKSIAYGLGNKGGAVLRQEFGIAVDSYSWNEKNNTIGRVYLEHAVFVSEVMVSLELACRKRGDARILYGDELGLPVECQPFRWWVKIHGGIRLGIIPDQVFALDYKDHVGRQQREYFFLEADRDTMPVVRKNLVQTSFHRKLLAYEATWINKVHQRHLGIPRFRVLTITTNGPRVASLLAACSKLKRGHGLFLFADQSVLEEDVFSAVWQSGKTGAAATLLNEPAQPEV